MPFMFPIFTRPPSHRQAYHNLMAYLLYGAGLRLLECCRLRVQDVDFTANQIVVRNAKGQNRVTMLPAAIKADLARHLEGVGRSIRATSRAGPGGSS